MSGRLNTWDMSRLIFPANGSLYDIGSSIEAYLDGAGYDFNITDLTQCSFAVGHSVSQGRGEATTNTLKRRGSDDSPRSLHQSFGSAEFRLPVVSMRPFSDSSSLEYRNTTSTERVSTAQGHPISSLFTAAVSTSDVPSRSSGESSLKAATPLTTSFLTAGAVTTHQNSRNSTSTAQQSESGEQCWTTTVWWTTIITTATLTTSIHNNHTRVVNSTLVLNGTAYGTPHGCARFGTETPQFPTSEACRTGIMTESVGVGSGNAPEQQGPEEPIPSNLGATSIGGGLASPNSKVTAVMLTAVTHTQPAVTLSSDQYLPDVHEPSTYQTTTEARNFAPPVSAGEIPTADAGSPQANGQAKTQGISTEGAAQQANGNSNDPSDGSKDGNSPGQNEPQNSNQPNNLLGNVIGSAIEGFESAQISQSPQNAQSGGNGDEPSTNSPQVVNIGGQRLTMSRAPVTQGVVIPGNTIRSGEIATAYGVAVSIAPDGNGLVIGGSTTVELETNGSPVPAPAITIGGETILANPSGAFVVAPDVTLSPGGPAITVSGSTLSLARGGTVAVINSVTQTLSPNGINPTSPPVLTIGNRVVTANVEGSTTAFVIGPGQTLSQGGVIIVSGTTLSLPSTGSAIFVNGQVSTLGPTPAITTAPVLTINGQVITASITGVTSAFILAPGTTLTPGGSVIISGTTYSLPSTASGVVIINGQTSSFGLATQAPALTINGKIITPAISNGQTSYVLGSGTTLTPGGVVTINGTRISLDSDETAVVFGSITSTIVMTPVSALASTTLSLSTTAGPGGAITSGLGVTGTHTQQGDAAGRSRYRSVLTEVVTSLLLCICVSYLGVSM